MKFILKTDYESSDYMNGGFTLIELAPDEARKILDLRQKAIAFMTAHIDGHARLRVSFPGVMRVFDDSDEVLADGHQVAFKSLADETKSFVRMPDDFEIPKDCTEGRIELGSLQFHHDGELWLEATADGCGDYLETEMPLQLIEQVAHVANQSSNL